VHTYIYILMYELAYATYVGLLSVPRNTCVHTSAHVSIRQHTSAHVSTPVQSQTLRVPRILYTYTYIHTYIHHTDIHQPSVHKPSHNSIHQTYIHTYIRTSAILSINHPSATYVHPPSVHQHLSINNCPYIHTYRHQSLKIWRRFP